MNYEVVILATAGIQQRKTGFQLTRGIANYL